MKHVIELIATLSFLFVITRMWVRSESYKRFRVPRGTEEEPEHNKSGMFHVEQEEPERKAYYYDYRDLL